MATNSSSARDKITKQKLQAQREPMPQRLMPISLPGLVLLLSETLAPTLKCSSMTAGTTQVLGKSRQRTKGTSESAVHRKVLRKLTFCLAVGLAGEVSTFTREAHAQDGVPLWTNRFNGPASGHASASSIAVDSSGDVFITGSWGDFAGNYNYATIKYSTAGVPLWTNFYGQPGHPFTSATAVAADSSGNSFVTGYSAISGIPDIDNNHATIKYSSSGTPIWTNRFDWGGGTSFGPATSLVVDSIGNVIVAGSAAGPPSWDYITVKYSADGVPLWTNRFNRPGNSADYASGLAVDSSNDLIVTGTSIGGSIDVDYSTIKYSSVGVPLWTNYYSGGSVSVDAAGSVVVTGAGDQSGSDYATIKYLSAGVPLWTNRYNGPGNSVDIARSLAVDSSGNVLVTGSSSGDTNGYASFDYATIKYSNDGVPLWTNRYIPPAGGPGQAVAMVVDNKGGVFVTGYSPANGSDMDNDYATVKYSSAGVPLWTNRYHGPGTSAAGALAADKGGNVFVTGTSGNDCATIKYSGPSSEAIPLNYRVVGKQLVLSWTNSTFALQAAPAAPGAYTNILGAASPYTNALSGPERYFRLKGN